MGLNKEDILIMAKTHGFESVYDQEVIPQDFIVEYACYLNLPFLYANNKLDMKTADRFDSLIKMGLTENMYKSIPEITSLVSRYFPNYRLEVIYGGKYLVTEVHVFIEGDVSFDITVGPNANTVVALANNVKSYSIPTMHYFENLSENGFLSKINGSTFHLLN